MTERSRCAPAISGHRFWRKASRLVGNISSARDDPALVAEGRCNAMPNRDRGLQSGEPSLRLGRPLLTTAAIVILESRGPRTSLLQHSSCDRRATVLGSILIPPCRLRPTATGLHDADDLPKRTRALERLRQPVGTETPCGLQLDPRQRFSATGGRNLPLIDQPLAETESPMRDRDAPVACHPGSC